MNEDARSAYDKLKNALTTERGSKYRFRARHMPPLYRKLVKLCGTKGMNILEADICEANADALRRTILRVYHPHEINAAHQQVVQDYKSGVGSKPRMDFQNKRIDSDFDATEDAFGDDTPRDQSWLDTEVNKTEAKQDNAKSNDDYITRPEFVRVHNEIKHNFNEVGRTFEMLSGMADTSRRGIEQLKSRVDALEQAAPTIIELKRPEQVETTKLGVQHKQFPNLLAMAHARENIWVYGPAGTGKSTAGEMLAVALFNSATKFFTNGKMENQFEVLGYRNAAGVYQTTQFREAYEGGGVYMADEIDGSMPSAVLALNGALANGHCPFPDKTVARHPDFIFIGAANTTGMGGTIEYVGRMKHDAAFLDRFVTLDWPLDDGLEDAICPNKKWLAYVRATRARLEKNPIKGHLITPRASIKGANLLAYGVAPAIVVKSTLQKGLSDTQWRQIEPTNALEF